MKHSKRDFLNIQRILVLNVNRFEETADIRTGLTDRTLFGLILARPSRELTF